MKRRRFVRGLLTVPAVMAVEPALLLSQRGGPGGAAVAPPEIAYSSADAVGEPVLRFFTSQQFEAFERLAGIVMPAREGNPGATETDATEFLDFLLSVSPASRQALYREGVDLLNREADTRYSRPFAELGQPEADAVLTPLSRVWSYAPSDPLERFLREAREDIRTATINSPDWAEAVGEVRNTRYLLPL